MLQHVVHKGLTQRGERRSGGRESVRITPGETNRKGRSKIKRRYTLLVMCLNCESLQNKRFFCEMGVLRLPNKKKSKEFFLLILCMHTPIHTDKHTLQSCLHNNYLCLFLALLSQNCQK